MAQRITKWQAQDGSVHDTELDAERHDHKARLSAIIEKMTCYGNVDPQQLLEALTTGDLGAEVVDYRNAWDS